TTRNTTAEGRAIVSSPELEGSICEEAEPSPSLHAQRPTSKIVWSSAKVSRSGELDDEEERNKTSKLKGMKTSETMVFSPSKNVEQLEEWPSATDEPVFSPQRAKSPPPLQLQETTPKTVSKAVEVSQVGLQYGIEEDGGEGPELLFLKLYRYIIQQLKNTSENAPFFFFVLSGNITQAG
ncbi:hypothetical protein TELCIR_21764, partial [Teladorsagia circumcincta]